MTVRNFKGIKTLLFDNLNIRQTIFKNTFWSSISLVVSKLLGLVLLIYVARILGAVEYGKFTFASSFTSLFVVFYSLGLPTIIIREFAREGAKKEDFYSIISLKVLLMLATSVLVLLSSFFITPEVGVQKIILLLALYSLIGGFSTLFYAFFQARQKMEYQAGPEILEALLMFGLGLCVLFKFPSVENLSYAYLFSALTTLIFVLIFFHFKIFPLKVKWDSFVWKKFLVMSWPLALTGLFGTIYGYIDSVMMGYLNMLAETGWYNAAYKIIIVSLIPMGLISGNFFPALSKFSKESKEKFQKIWNYQLEIMILLALPLMVGGMVLASKIIYYFYSLDFAPSVLAFQILILTAGITFLQRPLLDATIVLGQQAKIFWITLSGALVNISLNLLLIPKYSLYGAAGATVVTNCFILLIAIVFIKKFTFVHFPILRIFLTFLASALSVGLMYFVVTQLLIYNINIFLLVIAGAAIYSMVFLAIRKYVLLRCFQQIYA